MRKLFELMTDEKNPIWMWLPDNSAMFKFAKYLKENNVEIVPCGKWYDNICSVCSMRWDENMVNNADDWGYFNPMPNYCPNCGAKMSVE